MWTWFLATILIATAPRAGCVPAELRRTVDGDTALVRAHWLMLYADLTLRILGVDAPEKDAKDVGERARAVAAQNYLLGVLGQGPFVVCTDKTDHFGRWLADIYVDGASVGDLLVSAGHAKRLP